MRPEQISQERRKEIAQFLKSHAGDTSLRRRLAEEIFQNLQLNPKLQSQGFQGFEDLYSSFLNIAREYDDFGYYDRALESAYRNAESEMYGYCQRQDVFENYMEHISQGRLSLGEKSIAVFQQCSEETPSSGSHWLSGAEFIYNSLSSVGKNPGKSFVLILALLSMAPTVSLAKKGSIIDNNALVDLDCPPQFQNAKNIFFFGCGVCCDNGDGCLENTLELSREILPKAEKAGYTVASFLGENATIENYRSMLMCENIKIFYSVASHDDPGKSFMLADGDFDYQFMQNSTVNFKNTVFLMETCYAFDNPAGGGLCTAFTDYKPKLYVSGISPLSFWGATETYGCLMRASLNGISITPELLNKCAIENSPFVPNSRAGLYFAYLNGDVVNVGQVNFTIETTLNKSYVLKTSNTTGRAVRVHLDSSRNETVNKISASIPGMKTLNCTQRADDIPRILSNPLKAAEVALSVSQNGSCLFSNLFNPKYDPPVDQFGIYPAENCTGGENSSQSM